MAESTQETQEVEQRPQPRRGHTFYWKHFARLSVLLFVLLNIWWLGIPFNKLSIFFGLWFVYFMIYVLLYRDAVRKARRTYTLRLPWAKPVHVPPERLSRRGTPSITNPPKSHWNRIFSYLGELRLENPYSKEVTTEYEDQIKRWTRRHWIDLLRRTWLVGVVAAILAMLLVLGLFVGKTSGSYSTPKDFFAQSETAHSSSQKPVKHHRSSAAALVEPRIATSNFQISVPWWVPPLDLLVACLVFCAAAWVRSWKWSYRYTVLTQWHIMILTAPPPVLMPLLPSKRETVDLAQIITTSFEKEDLGYNFDQGSVGLDTQAQRDADFKDIHYLPGPEDWRNDLDNDRQTEQRRIQALLPDIAWQILEQLRQMRGGSDQPTGRIPAIGGNSRRRAGTSPKNRRA